MRVEMSDYAEGLLLVAADQLARPTAKLVFDLQTANEKRNQLNGLGAAPDFRVIFMRALISCAYTLRSRNLEPPIFPKGDVRNLAAVPDKVPDARSQQVIEVRRHLETIAGKMMDEMRAIEMADTIYPDVRSSMPTLLDSVDGALVWTSGHPNYQIDKIDRSKIETLMANSTSPQRKDVVREAIISRDKEPATIGEIYRFAGEHPGEYLTIVAYDDSLGKFDKLEEAITAFRRSDASGRQVQVVYVWAKVGRISEGLTDEIAAGSISKLTPEVQQNLSSVASFAEFTALVQDLRKGSNGAILTLLDFDGALSDNRIMRLRQYQAFMKHAVAAAREFGIVKTEDDEENLPLYLDQILETGEPK